MSKFDGKYGVREVFDLYIYDNEGLLFKIDTAFEVVLTRDFLRKENTLIVKDALLDYKLLSDIMNGKYDDRNLRLKGYSIFRNPDTYKDEKVSLNITIAKFMGYQFPTSCSEPSKITLEFNFPTKDYYGFMNCNFSVSDK